MKVPRVAIAGAVVAVAALFIVVQVLTPASPSGKSSAPAGGGIIVPNSQTPTVSATPSLSGTASVYPSASASSTVIPEEEQISLPGLAYVTYLHGVDYTLGFPGWKPSSFDGILTGDLLATQTRRNAAVAPGQETAGDQMTWDNLVATRTVTQTVIEKSVLAPKTGGGWLVQINWHLSTRANGSESRSGSNFTVITVIDVNGKYLASSDAMPQAP